MSDKMQPPAGERPSEAGKRSLVQRALDAIFGYDFFISYTRWDGGKDYAEALARRLKGAGFQIFFDSDEYAMGDDWKVEGRWALRRTSRLILVASPEALSSLATWRPFAFGTWHGALISSSNNDMGQTWRGAYGLGVQPCQRPARERE
jgi:hypothetical protein